jgi:hypothetical protein
MPSRPVDSCRLFENWPGSSDGCRETPPAHRVCILCASVRLPVPVIVKSEQVCLGRGVSRVSGEMRLIPRTWVGGKGLHSLAEFVIVGLAVSCVILYASSGVLLYRSLKRMGVERVGSIGVKDFAGTFADNVYQVVLRYRPRQFREYVEDRTARRLHSCAYYSSRCLLVCVLVLMVIRVAG